MSVGSTTLEIYLAVSTNMILNIYIPYHPLGIYPKKIFTSTKMFIVALFEIISNSRDCSNAYQL